MSKQEQKLETFEECCKYLGISKELPKCQIRERQHQTAYKLSVCMHAWNKHDKFEPDEKAVHSQKNAGYTPFFSLIDDVLSCKYAHYGLPSGLVYVYSNYAAEPAYANFGLRFCLVSIERAILFGQTFIQIYNELI